MFRKLLPRIERFLSLHTIHWWENKKFVYFLVSYGLFLGLLFTFSIPPFYKADEVTHYYRTISITQGTIICPQKNNILVNPLPKNLQEYPLQTSIITHPGYKSRQANDTEPNLHYEQLSACTLPFLSYLHTGIILTPLIWINSDPSVIFYAGRLTNLTTGIILMLIALKVVPRRLRLIPTSAYILPMTWHQISSFSKDGIHISFGVLAICLLIAFLHSKEKIDHKKILAFIVALLMTIIARPQYLPLSLLMFMIPYQNINRTKLTGFGLFGKIALIFLISSLISLSLVFNFYSVDASKLDTQPNYEVADADKQIQYLLNNPLAVITVPYYTFLHHGQFYVQSMIGTLGNLDIFLDWFVYIFIIILFVQIVFKTQDVLPKLSSLQLSVLTIVILGCLAGIMLAMYLYATKAGNSIVDGVQGRYFIVLLPLILWWLSAVRNKLEKKFDVFILLIIVLSIIKVTIGWYK